MKGAALLDVQVLNQLEMQTGPAGKLRAIDEFLASLPSRLDDACNAGRIGDSQSLKNILLRIREAAGHVGAVELGNVTKSIEKVCRYGAREVILPMLCQMESVMHRTEEVFTRERISLLMTRKAFTH